jgi:hypothetical protein
MNDEMKRLKDDIAFLKALTQDSIRVTARDGAIMAAVGVIFGLNAFQYWLIFAGIMGIPSAWQPWMWIDALALFVIVFSFLMRHFRVPSPNAAARAVSAAWGGVGIALSTSILALISGAWRLGLPSLVIWVFPVVLFTLYGSAWGVVFAVRKRAWFAVIAGGCFLAAIACGFAMGTREEWLVLSVGLFLLVAVPGFMIMRLAQNN